MAPEPYTAPLALCWKKLDSSHFGTKRLSQNGMLEYGNWKAALSQEMLQLQEFISNGNKIIGVEEETIMILETKRLILRPWEVSDAQDLYEYAKDPQVGPIAGWPPHTSVENSLEIINGILSKPETYAVVLKGKGHTVGSIGLMIGDASNIGLPDTEGEIGYWVGVPYWGQGIIPEAVKEMIRYAFEELKLEKLWCGYFDGNTKSKRVQEKCGFVYHHTNKDFLWPLMGDIRTEHITCLPKENWPNEIL